MLSLFDPRLPWFKGNLHSHTTLSDGRRTPGETAEAYREAGYHFIAITDHLRYFPGSAARDFVVLDGIECHDNHYRPGRVCHITGVGFSVPPPEIPRDTPPQQIIDTMRSCGAWVTLAHPAWSLMHHQDALDLIGYDALEIYSTISDTYAGRGCSAGYADVLASAGRPVLLTCVDDSHFHDRDALRAFVMVSAPALGRGPILEGLRQGRFYASNGPLISAIRMGGGVVEVECPQPMARIRFMSNAQWSARRVVEGPVRSAQYTLMPQESWLRIECEDECGRVAWSPFLPIDACRGESR